MAENSCKIVEIDKNKKLNEQNILKETKDIISILYYEYIADSEEKQEILEIWKENEKLYQKMLNEDLKT